MDKNGCVENVQYAESRVKILQAAWPTGDVAQAGAIDWNEQIKGSISKIAQSRLFQVATIFLTIAAVPLTVLPACGPLIWMAIGLWIIYKQVHRKNGEIGRSGFIFLMIGQYFGFATCLVGAFASFCVIVEGCTDLGKQYTHLQDMLFWGSGLVLILTFLIAGLSWKIVCAVKTIKEANEGITNYGAIPVGAIVECFVIGVIACLSVVGLVLGIAVILFGIVLVRYYKDMIRIEVNMAEHELTKAERCEIIPTWKRLEAEQK